jgi:hypothetical protein
MKHFTIIDILFRILYLADLHAESIKLGITKKEVIENIGEPTSSSAKKNTEYLNYHLTTGGFYTNIYYVRLLEERWTPMVRRVTSI